MKIGINGSSLLVKGASLGELSDHAGRAESDGFDSYWLGQLALPDTLTTLAMIGTRTQTIELGSAVVPTWQRHPLMLAAQALTVQQATGNRLALGIGLGHKELIESSLKIAFARTAQHMDEYLSILAPALTERRTSFSGEIWSGEADLSIGANGAPPPRLLLAAMGPRMLALAGGRSDGVILWLAGPRTIEQSIVPALEAAAADAGRSEPRVVAGLPVCVTSERDRVCGVVDQALAHFTHFDSYRNVLDREGVPGPSGVALIGSASEVRDGVAALAAAGATDFAATEFVTNRAEAAATRELLRELANGG
jgi:5,10-methylenetetrahydromethanopterin reductase